MAKKNFENYGGAVDHFEHEEKPGQEFNEVSGGGSRVDPFGDVEKKEKDSLDMNAGEAFNKKDYTKVDAMGTDYPKKGGKPGQFCDNTGDHFKVEDVDPSGNDAGKKQSFHDTKRS